MLHKKVLMSLYCPERQTGQALHFERCLGGHFSTREEYALKVTGRTEPVETTTEEPAILRCVRTGTRLLCGDSTMLVPCDLHAGDVWYPTTGIVNRADGSQEQYSAQTVIAPKGTVDVTQEAVELVAELSATMPVLKQRKERS